MKVGAAPASGEMLAMFSSSSVRSVVVPRDPARLPGRGQDRGLDVGRQFLQQRADAFADLRHGADHGVAVVDEDGEPDRPAGGLEPGRLHVLAVPLHDEIVFGQVRDRNLLGVDDGHVQGVLLGLQGRSAEEDERGGERRGGRRSKPADRDQHGGTSSRSAEKGRRAVARRGEAPL